jgi:predicted transposase YbfD/YdcC
MAAAAVLTGARSMTAIAEWAADAPQPVRAALGAGRDAPDHWSVPAEATIRRTLSRLDPDALATAIGAWLADRDRRQRRRRTIAVDGKTLRGARTPDGRQVHLLAAMDHTTRAVLDRCARLAWHRVPVDDRTRDQAHGRVELRTLKAVTVGHFGFPHAAQILQITRKTRDLGTRRWHTVVVYAITSLPHAQARPARLADLIRGHWTIENGLHWVRDLTFAEDASQLRTGSAPQVMASLRNLVMGALSRAGPVNLAAALRRHARDPHRPLTTLGISLG